MPVCTPEPAAAEAAAATSAKTADEDEDEVPRPSFGRLLRYARPESAWIVAGLSVLLLRLPFSLAMPHYVSVTLGCVLAHDAAGAERAIKLFLYANERSLCLPRCD